MLRFGLAVSRIAPAFTRIVEKINLWAQKFSAILVIPLLLITLYGSMMRYVLNRPPNWGTQVLMLLFIPAAVLGGGHLIALDEHVRLDLFTSKISPKGKAIVDIATFIFFFCFIVIFAWITTDMAIRSTVSLEFYWSAFKGPVYPKKIALALGALLVLLGGVSQLIHNILFLLGKEERKKD
jgi:TRAP-type mannitol/chloroaromatic compound transport system permease small subunit